MLDSNCMQMQSLEGTPACLDSRPELPLVEELISSLKKCRENKDLLCADHVRKSIHSHGLESYSVLGNYLVPVFVECGSVIGAQQVFNKLVHRNEHSWTSLIQGHIECGEFKHALNMFEKMQDDCVHPSKFTLQAVLRACSRLKYMNRVREVHIEITKEGLETDPFVGNCLVDVYAKCGSLADARAMTCKLLARNEALWSTLITVYADHGLLDEVLNCLHEMQLDGVAPDAVMLVHALKACGGTGAIGKGQELHAEIAQQGLESDLFVGNTLVDMYVKSGSLVEAQSILHKLPVRDVVSWTALIAGYAEHGLGDEVLNCLEQMRLEGISPNDVTYVCTLKGCGSVGAIHKGQELHAEIASEGFEKHFSVGTSVMDMYAKCGSLVEAWQVFEELSVRDVVSWNVVIAGYAEHGHGEEALKCLALMQKDGVTTNAVTFSSALKGCCSMGCLERGMEVHSEIAIEGFETDPFVGCTLVDMYAKCCSLTEAQDVFDELPVQNVVAWTALISGYAEHGLGLEAVECLKQMQMDSVFPNDATFVCILKGCSILEAMEKGQEVHTEIIKEGLERLPHIGSTLIDMYAKCGSLAEAQDVFDDLPVVDAVSWNALMAGHAEHGVREEVMNLFKKMKLEGVSPDAGTYVCSLKVCGSIGGIDKGQDLHMEIIKEGFEAGPFVGNTLVDMYAKCGSLAEAQEVFEELPIHDVVSWNALSAGYTEHKLSEEALHCLEQMRHEGVCADAVSFVCSLKACSSTGATCRGQEIHAELVKMGLEDDSSVCNTLVDIYAKWGFLAEAQEVFDHMSFRDIVSWNTLIGGYAEHMNGEEALKCLEEMHREGMPPNDVTFIVTLKACCMLAAIDEGQEMHVEITKGGLEKDPLVGKALVEMYWKCGSCVEALKVFHQLLFRDVFSWNQMITGYVEHGYDEEALTFMEQMQLEGVCPDPLTFVCSLKACGSLGALGMGQEMHLAIAKKGFEGEVFVANTLVHMYVHCGSLAEAHELFDELLIQDAVSWDALIAVYAEYGLGEEVLNCFDIMLLEGVPVTAFMLVCSLKACGSAGAIGRGHEIHAEVIKGAFERNTRVCNILVHMYAKCGLLGEARDVFDDIEFQDVVSWTALMAGCVEHGFGEEALICLEQMQVAGVSPNAFTFVCSLKACSSLGALGRGQEIHSEIANEGFETDHYVGSTLVDMYAKCGSLAEAQEVFEELAAGNVVSWNALITGYAEQGLSEGALDCLEQMLLEGVSPNAVTYVCILKACGSIGAIDKGRELHAEIAKEGYESDIYIGNTLVDMYAKSGLLVEALEMFDELLVKNIVSWTALIACYSSQGQSEVVFSLFERMIKSGVRPDGITLLSVLSVCSHAGYVEKGLTYFNTLSQDNGIRLTLEHYNSMVDLLSRAGQLTESLSVIEKMPLKPNFVTWRTLLGACRKWGDVQLGRHAFECAMKVDETQTAACILMYNIYVDANMWEDARKIDALRANIQARKQLGIS